MPEGPSADEVWKGDGGSASGLLREILSLELFAAASAALAVTMARDGEVRTHPLKGRLWAEADCREVALHVDDFVPDADVRDALGVLHALDLASTAVHRYEWLTVVPGRLREHVERQRVVGEARTEEVGEQLPAD